MTYLPSFRSLLVGCLASVALAAQASAQAASEPLRLTPVQDVCITGNDSVTAKETLGVANRGTAYIRRTLLQFNLDKLAESGRSVKSASLKLMPNGTIGEPDGTIAVGLWTPRDKLEPWDENTVKWSGAPQIITRFSAGTSAYGLLKLASAEFDTGVDYKQRVPMIWRGPDLVAWLNSARQGPDRLVTLILISEESYERPGVYFYSKDFVINWARAYAPVLEVELQ